MSRSWHKPRERVWRKQLTFMPKRIPTATAWSRSPNLSHPLLRRKPLLFQNQWHLCAAPSLDGNNQRSPLRHRPSGLNRLLSNLGSNNLNSSRSRDGLSNNRSSSRSRGGLSNNPNSGRNKGGPNRKRLWFNPPFAQASTAEVAVSGWTLIGGSVRFADNKTSAIDASVRHKFSFFEKEHFVQPNAGLFEHT